MIGTYEEAIQHESAIALRRLFERTAKRLLENIKTVPVMDLDKPFDIFEWSGPTQATQTTIRVRILQEATKHTQEHQAQLEDWLRQWNTAR